MDKDVVAVMLATRSHLTQSPSQPIDCHPILIRSAHPGDQLMVPVVRAHALLM